MPLHPSTSPKTGSLSILLPEKPEAMYAHQNINDKTLTDESSIARIVQMSRDVISSINNRDFDAAMAYASPHFRARHNNTSVEFTREQHFDFYRQMLTATDWHMDIFGEHAEVNEISGNALVWCFVKMSNGYDEGVSMDSLGLLHWQRRVEDGEWWVVYHAGFRSCAIF